MRCASRVRRAACGLSLLLLGACREPAPRPGPAPAVPAHSPPRPAHRPAPAVQSLVSGAAVEARGSGVYSLALTVGQFADVTVEQRGVDVAVALLGPDGKTLRQVDGLSGAQGVEPVPLVAERPGTYRLEIAAPANAPPEGRYTVRVAAVRPATDHDRRRTQAEDLLAQGEALRPGGPRAAAEAGAEREAAALRIFRDLGDRARAAETLSALAWSSYRLERYPEALASYQQALVLFRRLGDRRRVGSTLKNLGLVHQRLGRPADAVACFQQALAINRRLGERWAEAATLTSLGETWEALGEADRAQECYGGALALWRRLGRRDGEASTLVSLAALAHTLGQPTKALDAAERALAVLGPDGPPWETAQALSALGRAGNLSGHPREARAPLQRALLIQNRIGDRRGEGVTRNELGWSFLMTGDWQQAHTSFAQALGLFAAAGDRLDGAVALTHLAWSENELGRPRQALDAFDRALPMLDAGGDRVTAATARLGIARARRRLGDLEGARGAVAAALREVETVRSTVSSPDARTRFLASRQSLHELQIDILMALHRRAPGAGHDAEALAASEEARARGLLETLAEAGADLRRGAPPALLRREEEIAAQVNAADRRRRLLQAGGDPARLTDAQAELRRLLDQLDGARAAIRRASPRYAEISRPRTLSLREIQERVVDRDTILLEYALGRERSYLWAVTPEALASFELPPRAVIEDAVRRACALLPADDRTLARGQTDLALAELSRLLLAPAADLLGRKRLLIAGDGALHYLPFAALPAPGSGAPLIEEHEVVTLPSASSLDVLRRETAGRPPAPETLAVVADPVFGAADPRVPRPAGSAMPGAVTGQLARLPYSGAEAAAVLALAPPASRLGALGFAARRELILNGGLSRYRIVHFATHGLLDSEHPELSGIALSQVDAAGRPQDGFLRLHEIYRLHLPADLVVLSACRTALGQEIRGEGLVGLTRGFFYAGARSVLVSLWEVEDRATAELMRLFYRELLVHHQPPAAALRTAQTALRREPGWEAPSAWAGFVLQGDWTSRRLQ